MATGKARFSRKYVSANQINQLFLRDLINTNIHQQSSIINHHYQSSSSSSSSPSSSTSKHHHHHHHHPYIYHVQFAFVVVMLWRLLKKLDAFVPLLEQSPGGLYEFEWPHAGKKKGNWHSSNKWLAMCLSHETGRMRWEWGTTKGAGIEVNSSHSCKSGKQVWACHQSDESH